LKKIVFLGGTCGNNNWRDGIIDRFVARGVSREVLFNPVVADWNEAAQQLEDATKKEAAFNLFYLGDPQQEDNRVSFYSLLEATMGLYDQSDRTVVIFDTTGMPKAMEKSNTKACKDLKARFPHAPIFGSLAEAEDWLVAKLI
jgi:Nucleoside 2-deoxyribosyltransferase like